MNWLSSFYLKYPEYRALRVARRSPCSIHFELEPGVYEAHFQIKPIWERSARNLWLPAGPLAALGRLIGAAVRRPRLALEWAALLPFAAVLTLQPDGTAGSDNFTESLAPDANAGASTAVATGQQSSNGDVRRTFIKFDLSSIPNGSSVQSAAFSLWVYHNYDATNTRTVRVFRQKRAWSESQCTWNVGSM